MTPRCPRRTSGPHPLGGSDSSDRQVLPATPLLLTTAAWTAAARSKVLPVGHLPGKITCRRPDRPRVGVEAEPLTPARWLDAAWTSAKRYEPRMPRLDRLPKAVRTKLLTTPVGVNDQTPFTPPTRSLSESRLAIVTTAGLHLREDRPFEEWDPTFRAIPGDVRHADLLQSHTSIGFDRTHALRDINVVFPVDRVRELVERGVIGEVARMFYSFLGAQKEPERIRDETAPVVAERLRDDRVDLVLLTPT